MRKWWKTRQSAATVLAGAMRRWMRRRRTLGAQKIQLFWRHQRLVRQQAEKRSTSLMRRAISLWRSAAKRDRQRQTACGHIQALWRGHSARRLILAQHCAARRITSLIRQRMERMRRMRAATVVQRGVRRRQKMQQQYSACVSLQSFWRGVRANRSLTSRRDASRRIRKWLQESLQRRRNAAATIQRFASRCREIRRRRAAAKIMACWQQHLSSARAAATVLATTTVPPVQSMVSCSDDVQILDYGLEDAGFISYTIRARLAVNEAGYATRTLRARYSRIYSLHESLVAHGFRNLPSMPPKTWCRRIDTPFLDRRRDGLQQYLKAILSREDTRRLSYVMRFFQRED